MTYIDQFKAGHSTWLLNKYIGGGVKNFRYNCHIAQKQNFIKKDYKCSMHPHNYYLEILSETGIIGFALITTIFFLIFFEIFSKGKFFYLSSKYDTRTAFVFLLFVEVFPIKSSGSFFTTGNATYIFLIIGILIGLSRSYKIIEK